MERLDPDIVAADPRSHAVAMVTAVLWIEIDGRARWMRSRHRHFGGADDVILTYARAVDGADQGRATEAVELTQRALEGAESFSRMYAADLARAVAGTALSNLVLARMMQGTLRHDDPLLPNTVSLLRPEVPIMAAWIHLYWGLVALVDGDDDLAGALSAEFSAGTEGIVLAGARGPTTMIEGILAADRTDDPARLRAMAEHLLPAIETYSALGAETRAAITRYTAAFLFRRAGDLDRAAEERDRADLALRTFVDAPFVERFRDHLDARYASRPAGDAASPQLVEPLTDRELTVLRELATTRSPAEIADALHLSVHTVRSHTRAIYRKLSVGSRHGAVLRARELGY